MDARGIITELVGIAGGNALHVVTINSTQATVLEGAIVTGGQANGAAQSGCAYACGGGIYVTGGAPQLRDLRLIANYASDRGGGLYAGQSNAQLVASTMQANQATHGGGAFFQDARPQVVNALLAGNHAVGDGGGLYASNSAVRLVNVTVAANRAGGSGGGLLLGSGSSLDNAVVGGNYAPSSPQIGGSATTVQYSQVQDGCGGEIACSDHVQSGDPLFVLAPNPASAPTSLGDFHLQPTSPAIDQGNNNAGFDPSLPEGATISAIAVDVDNTPRIIAARTLPPRVDMGAYEALNAPPVFTTTPDTVGGISSEYVYEAVAVDPNAPDVRLPIVATVMPQWLAFTMQPDGAGKLQGTPGKESLGSYEVVLRATDSLGALGQQYFVLQVRFRAHPVFMPQVLVQK